MRILIVGAGSTGGYFGARLAQAGRDVTFLVRPKRRDQLQQDGLQVVSPHGDFTIVPQLVTAADLAARRETFDLILVTVKAYALASALEELEPAVAPTSTLLPVLNGMRHMDLLAERFGAQALVGGVCKIASTLDAHGRVVQLQPFHEIAYGEMDGLASARIHAVDALMQGAGFDAKLSADIAREMWEKWILLASLGMINCLMRGTVGEINSAPGGRAFVDRLFDEVVSVVHRVGKTADAQWLQTTHAFLTNPNSPMTSSMYRDLCAGGPIEAEQIVGDLLARAAAAELETPLIAAAYANLSVYQAQRQKATSQHP